MQPVCGRWSGLAAARPKGEAAAASAGLHTPGRFAGVRRPSRSEGLGSI